jgi:hypothetical protein
VKREEIPKNFRVDQSLVFRLTFGKKSSSYKLQRALRHSNELGVQLSELYGRRERATQISLKNSDRTTQYY